MRWMRREPAKAILERLLSMCGLEITENNARDDGDCRISVKLKGGDRDGGVGVACAEKETVAWR